MKVLLIILLNIACSCRVYSQTYAVINTSKGNSVSIRAERNSHSKIVGKLHSNDIFGCDNSGKLKWVNVYKLGSGKEAFIEGYALRSNVTPLSKYKHLSKINSSDYVYTALNDSLSVAIKSKAFNPKQHKLTYRSGFLTNINGNKFWGTDGESPKRSIISVSVVINGLTVDIPPTAYNDLYEPNFSATHVYLSPNHIIYIQMNNSDGAGGYSVIWIIKDGKYSKRFLDDSNA